MIARACGRLLQPWLKNRYLTTRYGAKLVIDSRNMDFYATMVRWNYSWEHWIFDTAHWLMPDHGTFYDIGANVGYMGLEMLQRKPHSNMVCFEPIPALAKVNRESIELNGFANRAQVFQTGLSNQANSNSKLSIPSHQGHATLEADFIQRGARQIEIEVQQLDELVRAHDLPLPDVIKIDVEGHEIPALTGAVKTLSASKPHVLFEANNAQQLKGLKTLLEGIAEYRFYYATGSYHPLQEVAGQPVAGEKFDVIAVNIERHGLPDDVITQINASK